MSVFNKMLAVMLRPWFIFGFCLLAMISYLSLDKSVALYFYGLQLGKKFVILTWITKIGMAKVYLIVLPLLALIFAYVIRKKNWALKTWILWFLLLYPALVTWVLKNLLGRARPEILFKDNVFGFFGWNIDSEYHSFPSGHTTTMTSLAISLTILFPKYCKYWFTICILVILSRIILTYHYVSDVLVTFYLIFLEMGIIMYIMQRKFPKTYELILK